MKKVIIPFNGYMELEAEYSNADGAMQLERAAVKSYGPKNPWGLTDPATDEVIRVARASGGSSRLARRLRWG